MWFRFPEGVGGISVEGQEFDPEFVDKEGVSYFRAPDHFAPRILGEDGFRAVAAPPDANLPDLPTVDTSREGAILALQAKVDALELEREGLRTQVASLTTDIEALRAAATPAGATTEDETAAKAKK